ncbi:MAG: hypothetical protein P4L46_14705 [Fimbriimonas sp.]|nr:hypothetical protein [Fimbriimonas sp.]
MIALGIGGAVVVGLMFLGAILFPVFAQARRSALGNRCLSNMRRLNSAVTEYAADNDGAFPVANRWMDDLSLKSVRPRQLRCPAVGGVWNRRYGYAFNSELSSKRASALEKDVPVIFDSTLVGRNATSGLETLPKPGRHFAGSRAVNHVLMTDGSVTSKPN